MSDAIDPKFEDLLKLSAKRHGAEQGHRDLPARVVSYDRPTQTVNVQPLVLVPRNDVLRPLAILTQMQVRWPAGSGWSIVGDLVPGDFGWIRFAGADISAWKMQGTEQDPLAIKRSGALSDAEFEPGSQPVSVPLPAAAWKAGALVIRAVELLLGSSAAVDPVALSSVIDAIVVTIAAAFDPHVHADPVTGVTGTPVTPGLTPITIGSQPSTAATRVKAI